MAGALSNDLRVRVEGLGGQSFGPPGCSDVRCRDFDSDPMDRGSQDGGAGGAASRPASWLEPRCA